MDMQAIGVAANAVQMANTAGAGTKTADISFAQMLASATGMGTISADGQVDFSGLSWRDIQNGMMLNAMQGLSQAEKPISGDPVLQQLLNMMQELTADGEVDLSGDSVVNLIQLIEQMQKRLQEILQEQGATVAGQEMLALMNALMPEMTGMPMADGTYEAMAADGGQAMLQMMLETQPADMVRFLMEMPVQYQPSQSADVAQQLLTSTATQANADPMAEFLAAAGMEQEGTGAAATALATAQANPAESFEAAVREAKQQMGVEEETQPEKPALNIDELQQEVDAGTFLRNTPLANSPEVVAEGEMAEAPAPPAMQLADPIRTAITGGEQQLTVRLMPEELGEITIQLTRGEDGIQISIIAKSAETQNILAGQLDMLKDTLRPMNAEVGEVLSQQQYELMSQQDQYRQQRQNQPETLRGAAYYGDEPLGAEADASLSAVMAQAAPNTALDTYI